MMHSHYDIIPNWGEIQERTKEQDNYTCQGCDIKEGIVTFPGQVFYPSYAESEGEVYVYYKPYVQKINSYLAAIPENIRGVVFYKYEGYWYKIFNITQNEEVFIYVIEEKIPEYPAAMVKKVLVKSIRPETSWLRIQ